MSLRLRVVHHEKMVIIAVSSNRSWLEFEERVKTRFKVDNVEVRWHSDHYPPLCSRLLPYDSKSLLSFSQLSYDSRGDTINMCDDRDWEQFLNIATTETANDDTPKLRLLDTNSSEETLPHKTRTALDTTSSLSIPSMAPSQTSSPPPSVPVTPLNTLDQSAASTPLRTTDGFGFIHDASRERLKPSKLFARLNKREDGRPSPTKTKEAIEKLLANYNMK